MGDSSKFERSVELAVSAETAFRWHANSGALERMLPPWAKARVKRRDPDLIDGSRVVLELQILGIWRDWVAEHLNVVEGKRFEDRQVEGPFRQWLHRHIFEDTEAGNCRMEDRIEFEGPLHGLSKGVVRKELERGFAYRHEIAKRDIERFGDRKGEPTVAIAGGSGFLGNRLANFLRAQGCEAKVITRSPNDDWDIAWDPKSGKLDERLLEEVDVVVNLAGAGIADGRWTDERRKLLRSSRIDSLVTLNKAFSRMNTPPRLLISSSGIGFYGDRSDEPLEESMAKGKGFLAELSEEWESHALAASESVARVAVARTGMVIDPGGGALAKMWPAFRAGLGGRLGDGKQWLAWIALEDWMRAIDHLIDSEASQGVYNLCSPRPIRNAGFAKTLGKVANRPAIIPAPKTALKLAFGQMAEEALLSSGRAIPSKLESEGFSFAYPDLEDALRFSTGRS